MRKTLYEDIVCKEYLSGLSNSKISDKYSIHRSTVLRILKRNNIELRMQDVTSRKNIIKNFDGNILTNNDAYLLGLIFSDGNLFKNNIEICLNATDKHILSDVSNYVYGYQKLSYRDARKDKKIKQKEQVRFIISSKHIADNLRKIGLIENKSLKIRFPNIDKKFYSHFIRGFFDGDGCIFISKKYKNTNRITIVSNENFCNDLKKIIEEFLRIKVYVNNKTENAKIISISGNNQIKIFLEWIYKDADLKLNRKYYKYVNHFL